MGTNEKHAATYHGREYTPSTQAVRALFSRHPDAGMEAYNANLFDRWLSKARAEAKREALEEAADWVRDNGGDLVSRGIEEELTYRANQYKEN